MASSSTNIVPVFASEETPARYFSLRPEDYAEVEKWLAEHGFEYGRFFASYINYTCAQRHQSKTAQSEHDYAAISPFLENISVSAIPFLQAMEGYIEKWSKGGHGGEIKLVDANEELEKAQRRLASVLYSSEQQKTALAESPELEWLLSNKKKVQKSIDKANRRKVNKATKGMDSMDLGEDDDDDDDDE